MKQEACAAAWLSQDAPGVQFPWHDSDVFSASHQSFSCPKPGLSASHQFLAVTHNLQVNPLSLPVSLNCNVLVHSLSRFIPGPASGMKHSQIPLPTGDYAHRFFRPLE